MSSKSDFTVVQLEILKALEQLSNKAMYSEAILAKKIRENNKITIKNKAGIGLADLEKAIDYLGENNISFYSLHLNSANDLLIKKDNYVKYLEGDARKRRLSSEKSMSILTSGDFKESPKKNQSVKNKKRVERKNINIHSNFEDLDY